MGEAKKTIRKLHEQARGNRHEKAEMSKYVLQALRFWEKTNTHANALMLELLAAEERRAAREFFLVKWIKKLFGKQTRMEKFAAQDYAHDKWRVRTILGGMEQLSILQIAERLKIQTERVKSIMLDIQKEETITVTPPPPRPSTDDDPNVEVGKIKAERTEPQTFDEGVGVATQAGVSGA